MRLYTFRSRTIVAHSAHDALLVWCQSGGSDHGSAIPQEIPADSRLRVAMPGFVATMRAASWARSLPRGPVLWRASLLVEGSP